MAPTRSNNLIPSQAIDKLGNDIRSLAYSSLSFFLLRVLNSSFAIHTHTSNAHAGVQYSPETLVLFFHIFYYLFLFHLTQNEVELLSHEYRTMCCVSAKNERKEMMQNYDLLGDY